MQDFSFLRLSDSFAKAKQINDPKWSDDSLKDFKCICLHPEETYVQTTNSKVDIAFDNDYKVELIDCAEKILKDITDNTTIFQFTNSISGIKNIAFEIISMGITSAGNPCFLRFTHTTGSEIFYSNPFFITDEPHIFKNTLRIAYKCYGYFYGTDYINAPYYQSIRVSARLLNLSDTTETKTYKKVNGRSFSDNPNISYTKAAIFEEITEQCAKALSVALKSDEVYIESGVEMVRETGRQALKIGEYKGQTNLLDADATLFFNEDDVLFEDYQFSTRFRPTIYYPTGYINEDDLLISAKITFNKSISIVPGGLVTLKKGNGDLVGNYSLAASGSNAARVVLSLDTVVTTTGDYYFTFPNNVIKSVLGENYKIDNTTEWRFTFSEGFYSKIYYEEDNYLT